MTLLEQDEIHLAIDKVTIIQTEIDRVIETYRDKISNPRTLLKITIYKLRTELSRQIKNKLTLKTHIA